MEPDDPAGSAALRWLDPAMDASTGSGAEEAVGALHCALDAPPLRTVPDSPAQQGHKD